MARDGVLLATMSAAALVPEAQVRDERVSAAGFEANALVTPNWK